MGGGGSEIFLVYDIVLVPIPQIVHYLSHCGHEAIRIFLYKRKRGAFSDAQKVKTLPLTTLWK